MSSLFRKEAIEARNHGWLGSINIATPLSSWLLASMAFTMAAALIAFLFFGHYTRRARVSGELVPSAGLLNVRAANAGVVSRVDVKEGQHVHRGDPLVEISGDLDSADMGATRAQISQRLKAQRVSLKQDLRTQADSFQQQTAQLKTQLQLLTAQARRIDAQSALQRQEIHSDRALLKRIQPLLRKGYVSAFQVQQQQSTLLQALAQFQAFARQRAQLDQQLSDARQKLAQLPLTLKTHQASTQRQIDSIEQQLAQNEAQRSVVMRAPTDGVVSSLLVSTGQAVSTQQPLLSVLPHGTVLTARLLVPSSAVGFVDPGSRVVLRYQAYPYQKFGQYYGRVFDISRSALSPADVAALTGQRTNQPLYQVRVKLDRQAVMVYGRAQVLKPGMELSADILMDRRSLIEWVFEPLYGITHRLAPESIPLPDGGLNQSRATVGTSG